MGGQDPGRALLEGCWGCGNEKKVGTRGEEKEDATVGLELSLEFLRILLGLMAINR